MNKVPVIRKGSFKRYLKSGPGIGFFLIALPVSWLATPQESLKGYIVLSVLLFLLTYVFCVVAGFLAGEYFFRKRALRHILKSGRYDYLSDIGFMLNDELFIEGSYRDYYFQIIPMIKYQKNGNPTNFDIIAAFYRSAADESRSKQESNLSGDYCIGEFSFANNCAACVPKDWEAPDFKENLEQTYLILKRSGLQPLSKQDWLARQETIILEEQLKNRSNRKRLFKKN